MIRSDGPLLNMVKRAPMGFQGMRGKKNHEDDHIPLDNSYLLPNEVARGLLVFKLVFQCILNKSVYKIFSTTITFKYQLTSGQR